MDLINSNINKKLLFNFDRIIAIVVIVIAILLGTLFLIKGYQGLHFMIILASSSTLYLSFRDNTLSNEDLPHIPESKSNRTILSITHIIFFNSVTLLLWFSWTYLYYRPPLYFIVVLIAASSIIINIFCIDEINNLNSSIVLIKIITLSYIVYAGIYFQFAGVYGTDPWYHNQWIHDIINNHHLSESHLFLDSYYSFPLFPINGAITTIITSLSIYSSIFASYGFLMATSCIFLFIICRRLINEKVALLASLIIPLTANNIEKSSEIIPMSFGYIFFTVITCVIIYSNRKLFENRILICLLSIALIFTHTIATLAMLASIIAFFIGAQFYTFITSNKSFSTVFSGRFIMFLTIGMIAKWMQAAPGSTSFFDVQISHFIATIQTDASIWTHKSLEITNMPYTNRLFNDAGYYLLLFLSIIGSLRFLHLKKSTSNKVGLVFFAGILVLMIYLCSMLGITNILPYRWFLFLYLPLSILAISGLLWISNLIRGENRRLAFIMLVILTIIFSMTTNNIANKDSPFIFNDAKRYGYTQSELAAIHTFSNVNTGKFVSDIYFSIIFPFEMTADEYNEMIHSNKSIFIQRNYYLNNPEWNANYKVSFVRGDPYNIIFENVFVSYIMKNVYHIDSSQKIYNNGDTKLYIV